VVVDLEGQPDAGTNLPTPNLTPALPNGRRLVVTSCRHRDDELGAGAQASTPTTTMMPDVIDRASDSAC
jgi:hypothetical protein